MSGTRTLIRWGRLALEFKLPDLWVGAFWTDTDVWVCVVPCLPIHYYRRVPFDAKRDMPLEQFARPTSAWPAPWEPSDDAAAGTSGVMTSHRGRLDASD